MKLVFATSNANKIKEVKPLLGDRLSLLGLKDINCLEEIPETTGTIEGNAVQKAQYVYDNYGIDCFAEDTGLEVVALDMKPGVNTARYAGEAKDPKANMAKMLDELEGEQNRAAQFRTVIAYIKNGKVETFEGIVKGRIAIEEKGTDGFGYDPIFIPENEERTFAEMTQEEKNQMSHRARALEKFIQSL